MKWNKNKKNKLKTTGGALILALFLSSNSYSLDSANNTENGNFNFDGYRLSQEMMKIWSEDVIAWVPSRCEPDNLSQEEAIERNLWMQRCLNSNKRWKNILELIGVNSRDGRPQYVTFGSVDKTGMITNPEGYRAPTDRGADCESNMPPSDYVVSSVCVSGCWVPGQTLSFGSSGNFEVETLTLQSHPTVQTLRSGATLEDLRTQSTVVESYIESTNDATHSVVEIGLSNGQSLHVTSDHPVLLSEGIMIRADQLSPTNQLLSPFGTPVNITSLQTGSYFGKVYNLRLGTADLAQNIVISSGVLNGTSFYQNEGISYLNLQLLRENNLFY